MEEERTLGECWQVNVFRGCRIAGVIMCKEKKTQKQKTRGRITISEKSSREITITVFV